MHLHHLRGVLTLCCAEVTKLLKLQLIKISRLKCSHVIIINILQIVFIIQQ